jgi:sirohydrochlorin cobaltochelatase
MMRDTTLELSKWLERGGSRVGEIAIVQRPEGGWLLSHHADAGRLDLEVHQGAAAARALANLDDAAAYRPLKTAPNLRRGWALVAADIRELRKAIDTFYPAMLGLWLAQEAGEVTPVDFRETLGRQTGMYRVTQKITDPDAQALIGRMCEPAKGCLKTILWKIAPGVPITSLPAEKFQPAAGHAMPLYCHEACNLVVAGARKVVKGE